MPLVEEVFRDGKRGLKYCLHPGQQRAWDSAKRVVAVIAGVRSGKTSFGPLWLHRECARKGPGDYLVAAPSLKLIDKAAGPEFEHHFVTRLRLGTLTRRPWEFTFSDEGARRLWGRVPERRARVLFGHADDPESLAAMTAKAAWLDEAGQKRFRLASWEEIQRRLSFDRGRCLVTTTPYDLGWLKKKLHDPWQAAGKNHPEIDLVRFDSTENPDFPRDEYERARRDLPAWKFHLFFRALFVRPAGQIYDSFTPKNVIPRFTIDPLWERYGGLDFGATNTAAVMFAREEDRARVPTGRFIAYKEHHPAEKWDLERHVTALLDGEPRLPTLVGGNPQEQDWRDRFARAGLPCRKPPVRDVEVGIDAVYAACTAGNLLVMDDLAELLDEFETYSHELDDAGEPTEKIEAKSSYHLLDSVRYLFCWLAQNSGGGWDTTPPEASLSTIYGAPAGVFLDGGNPWD